MLAPRSRVCACFEVVTRFFPSLQGNDPFSKTTCRQRLFAPGRLFSRLDRSDVFCLETFGPLSDAKFDCLAFLQPAKAAWLDSRKMHENVVARLAADEAEAFGIIKPFHCSLFHCVPVSILNFCSEESLRVLALVGGTDFQLLVNQT